METQSTKASPSISYSGALRSFNEIVCQSIDKTLESLLGSKAADALYVHLRERFGVDRNELPYRIETISSVLESVFGIKGASVIERKVARNLFGKILLPFNDEQGSRLEDFVKIAKETVSRDSHYV